MSSGGSSPVLSVIMANWCGERFLDAAIASVLRQRGADLELIVSDDASIDASPAMAEAWATRDPRVQVIRAPANAGPAAARNRALDRARGEWIAVVDSDDLLHPDRLSRMIAAARRLDADIVADDMVFFGDHPLSGGRTLLQPMALTRPAMLTTAQYLRASGGDRATPPLGYLKPLFRREAIGATRYDETLRIGEDYDLCLRLVMGGARYALLPDPMYLYRRHGGSISHRLSVPQVQAMIAATGRLPPPADAEEAGLRAGWQRRLARQLRYEELVALIKARRLGPAALRLTDPVMMGKLATSLRERLQSRIVRPAGRGEARLRLREARGGAPARPGSATDITVAFPPVPSPGADWAAPPARAAAALSDAACRYRLSWEAEDATGEWAAWLLPQAHD